MNPIATFAMPRFASLASTPPAAPAPSPAPAPAPTASCDNVRISSLHNAAAVCRHNGVVGGLGIGAISAMLAMAGSVPGALICGAMGVFVAGVNFSRASEYERQAAQLERQCGRP